MGIGGDIVRMGRPAAIILYNRWYFARKEGFAVSGNRTFSHITVSSDEEEDFVIEAGVRSDARFDDVRDEADEVEDAGADEAGGACEAACADARLDVGEDEAAARGVLADESEALDDEELAAGEEEAGCEEDGAQPQRSDQPQRQKRSEQQRRSSSTHSTAGGEESSYRETTMEDLESAPMSTMQKAIVVVALLAIVAAVVYYFVFMH